MLASRSAGLSLSQTRRKDLGCFWDLFLCAHFSGWSLIPELCLCATAGSTSFGTRDLQQIDLHGAETGGFPGSPNSPDLAAPINSSSRINYVTTIIFQTNILECPFWRYRKLRTVIPQRSILEMLKTQLDIAICCSWPCNQHRLQ